MLALLPQARFGLFAWYNCDGVPASVPAYARVVQRSPSGTFVKVEPPLSGNSARLIGTYQSTRRVESNFFSLRALFEGTSVRGTGKHPDSCSGALPFRWADSPSVERKPGQFGGAAIDATFGGSGASAFMQLGAPVLLYNRVPWFASARACGCR